MNEVKSGKSYLLILGGILQIVLAFVCAFLGIISISATINLGYFLYDRFLLYQATIGIVGIVAFAFGLAGGIFSLRKTRFSLALLGTFAIGAWNILLLAHILLNVSSSMDRFSGLVFGFFMILLTVLSLVFVAISRKEFKKEGVE